ncbi:hypothetical protein [Pseudozobellia thermophila]|uniref:hypothetical protein n=1 Tax=Pseudozobellia thermophila TaxID=192903 RepID=UPI000934FEBF|nr:hypothetical protein [Pseudozobellia thermophila]
MVTARRLWRAAWQTLARIAIGGIFAIAGDVDGTDREAFRPGFLGCKIANLWANVQSYCPADGRW